MKKDDKGMYVYFALIALYILTSYLEGPLGITVGLILKILLVGGFLIYFREWFPIKLRFDWLAIVSGIGIAVLWFFLDPFYPHLMPVETVIVYGTLDIILKLIVGVVFASIVEEFFTRFFLHRAIEHKSWLKAPLGQYSLIPFIVTTLFFGLSHSRWVVGLITGVILNLIWYKRKDMNSIVLAHGIANLVLGLLIIITSDFSFWS